MAKYAEALRALVGSEGWRAESYALPHVSGCAPTVWMCAYQYAVSFFLICQVMLIEFMWLSFSLSPCFSFCICSFNLCSPSFHISHLTNLHNGLMLILQSNSNPFLHSTPTDPSFVQANVNSLSTIAKVLYSSIWQFLFPYSSFLLCEKNLPQL